MKPLLNPAQEPLRCSPFWAKFFRAGSLALPLCVLDVGAQSPPPPEVARLDPVVVTASRTSQALSSVLSDISVLERKDIEQSGSLSVAEVLARLPGIEFASNGGPASASSVFIRGSETRHTAVYIDGVRVDSQSTGGPIWEQIPLEHIERIEVLRGPAAAVYGSDAVAGVVQLFTRRGQGAPQPTGSVRWGSYGTRQAQAGVSGGSQEVSYALSASHAESSGFDARTAQAIGHNPDEDGYRRSSLQARLGWQITPVHSVEASVLDSRQRSEFDNFVPNVHDETKHLLRTGNVAWEGRWNPQSSTRVQWGQTNSDFETQPQFYSTQTTLKDLTLQHKQQLGAQWLTGTLERRQDTLHNPATPFSDALNGQRHQDGVALGWRTDVGAHGLQAHVRHDNDSEFGSQGTGSLAWGWAWVPQWRLLASAATSFRVPTLYQRFSEYGNPSLVPEKGRNVEVGVRYASQASEASLSAWRNHITDLISFGDPGACLSAFGCFTNVGNSLLRGVTLAGRTRWGGVALHGSLSWHDPRNQDTGKLLQRRARRLATLGADTHWAGLQWGAQVQAAGVRFEDAANTRALGGYGLLGVSLSKALSPGWTLEARIDNLSDKTYELARTYATAGRTAQVALRWSAP